MNRNNQPQGDQSLQNVQQGEYDNLQSDNDHQYQQYSDPRQPISNPSGVAGGNPSKSAYARELQEQVSLPSTCESYKGLDSYKTRTKVSRNG